MYILHSTACLSSLALPFLHLEWGFNFTTLLRLVLLPNNCRNLSDNSNKSQWYTKSSVKQLLKTSTLNQFHKKLLKYKPALNAKFKLLRLIHTTFLIFRSMSLSCPAEASTRLSSPFILRISSRFFFYKYQQWHKTCSEISKWLLLV